MKLNGELRLNCINATASGSSVNSSRAFNILWFWPLDIVKVVMR